MRFVNYFHLLALRAGVIVFFIGIIVLIDGHLILGLGYLALGSAFVIGLIIKNERYNRISQDAYANLNRTMIILMIVGIILIGLGYYNFFRLYT